MGSGTRNPDNFATQALTTSLINQIRELIELAPGSRLLPERELAQKLTVSRSSLRQAIEALETMGVLASRVGVGTFVRSDLAQADLLSGPVGLAVRAKRISPAKLFELRRLLEVEVAGLAAARATDEAIASVGHEIERMHANPAVALADGDYGVHLAVVRGRAYGRSSRIVLRRYPQSRFRTCTRRDEEAFGNRIRRLFQGER